MGRRVGGLLSGYVHGLLGGCLGGLVAGWVRGGGGGVLRGWVAGGWVFITGTDVQTIARVIKKRIGVN